MGGGGGGGVHEFSLLEFFSPSHAGYFFGLRMLAGYFFFSKKLM